MAMTTLASNTLQVIAHAPALTSKRAPLSCVMRATYGRLSLRDVSAISRDRKARYDEAWTQTRTIGCSHAVSTDTGRTACTECECWHRARLLAMMKASRRGARLFQQPRTSCVNTVMADSVSCSHEQDAYLEKIRAPTRPAAERDERRGQKAAP
jgi:hypothetical protein